MPLPRDAEKADPMTTPHIDLTPIITEAGGRGLKGEDFDRAAAFLNDWHGAGANEHGSFIEADTVLLATIGRCKARVRIVRTGRGHWLAGHDFEAQGFAGSAGGPSIWDSRAFATRDDATRYIADKAADWFGGIARDKSSCVSDQLRRDAERMVAALELVVSPKPAPAMQLSLF